MEGRVELLGFPDVPAYRRHLQKKKVVVGAIVKPVLDICDDDEMSLIWSNHFKVVKHVYRLIPFSRYVRKV